MACLANIRVSHSREYPHDVSETAHLVLLPLSLHTIKGKEYKNKEVCVCPGRWDGTEVRGGRSLYTSKGTGESLDSGSKLGVHG